MFKKVLFYKITGIMAATVLTASLMVTPLVAAASATASESTSAGDSSGKTDAPGDPPGKGKGAPAGGNGGQTAVTSWTAANEITSDTASDNTEYTSSGTDENALHVYNGASAVLNDPTVTRTSSDSKGGDDSSFYGVGAAVLTTDGTTTVNGGTVTTDSAGAAGLFSYDKGITYAKNVTINTKKDTSGGIHVAGGGKIYAWDLNVTTNGESAAAIRSDRGGGTMRVNGGSYTSNGVGSPAVYCTADIAVNKSDLTANGSEGLCLEGNNSARLFDSDLTSDMSDDSQNDTTWSAIVYQSMSGDSEAGKGTFEMVGGSFTSKNGGLIYTTNTKSDILMSNVKVKMADDAEFFLRCTGNNNQRGWGTAGANGADCNFTADDQEMNGNIIYDSISNLDFYMENGSTLKGAFIDDESCAGNGGSGKTKVYIDNKSTWTVTGNSTVTDLYNAGTIKDADGKTVTIVGTDGKKYVEGDSVYTITVSSYSTDADISGALTTPSWSDYEVAEPTAEAASAASTVTGYVSETANTAGNAAEVIVIAAAALTAAAVIVKKRKK